MPVLRPGEDTAPAENVTPGRYVRAMTPSETPRTTEPADAGDDPTADHPPVRVAVAVSDRVVRLDGLECDDPTVATVLRRIPVADRPEVVRRMLGIGARALADTAVGVDLVAMDERVTQTLEHATRTAEDRVRAIVSETEQAVRGSLDPDSRTSAMGRAIAEMERVQRAVLDSLDPGRTDSHTSAVVRSLHSTFGPGGELQARLEAAFDPNSGDGGLAGFRRDVERSFAELRELLAEHRGRRVEALTGTRKGFDFEDVVEHRLRDLARPLGATVTRTSEAPGSMNDALVGDFVVTLGGGVRIVVEAKNTARVGLDGSSGILDELDRALVNREAAMAICVSANDAFPAEVGHFGVYGNRILVVDDGDGTLLEVALRWATTAALTAARAKSTVDADRILESIDRIRRLVRAFSTHRRALTESMDSLGRVRDALDELRRDLLAEIDEIGFEVERRPAEATPRSPAGLRTTSAGFAPERGVVSGGTERQSA